MTSRFGWGGIWNGVKGVTKAFCNLVSVVSFAVATAVSKVATVINAPILHVFAAVTYFTGVVAQVIADQLVPDPYYPTDSSGGGGGTQMDPPVVFIWEVDEHGSPAEVPTNSALYFDNDGTIHLHVKDDVNTKKYFKVATSLGAFDVMTVQHSLLSQDFEHKVVACEDMGFSTNLISEHTKAMEFCPEFYLEISRTTGQYDSTKSKSYIFLSFPGLNAIMQLNGQKAELETELEDATGADVRQKCHNSFKINICESQTFCQSPAAP